MQSISASHELEIVAALNNLLLFLLYNAALFSLSLEKEKKKKDNTAL